MTQQAATFEGNSDSEANETGHLTLVVDLDERGSFRAHVENAKGDLIFDFTNEDDGGLWLVEFGYMDHARDTDGLLSYLQAMDIVDSDATMTLQG